MNNKYIIRKAEINDIPILVKHHSMMFEEITILQGSEINTSGFEAMEKSYSEKLKSELPIESFNAWVVEYDNKIIASGAITICSMVPVPFEETYHRAYLHSMYTEKSFRKQGLAVQIIDEIKKYCNQKGIVGILLSSSDAGRHLYESIGFQPTNSYMICNNKK